MGGYMKLHSYSKVWAIGHRETADLFKGPIIIQEKIDGSQFSFGNIDGVLHCRSKGQPVGAGGNQEGMFKQAVHTADLIFRTGTIPNGMCVRCEFLQKPKHNVLAYSRVPTGNLIIFDITLADGTENYLEPSEMQRYADMWGLETVPTFHVGEMPIQIFRQNLPGYLSWESVLGGVKIEGVVVKNNAVADSDGKRLCGKYVSEQFKEAHTESWKSQQTGSVIEQIIASFNKEAIWQKAIQHAREDGVLLNESKDIGYLIGQIKGDFNAENSEWIKRKIFEEFYDDIVKGVTNGFPQWYKQKLMENQNDQ